MTLEDLKELQWRLQYKGKQCFAVFSYNPRDRFKSLPEGYIYTSTWVHAVCSHTNTETKIEIGGIQSISEESNLDSMLTNIRDTIMMLEMHEVNECFKMDGQILFDPHSVVRRISVDQEAPYEEIGKAA